MNINHDSSTLCLWLKRGSILVRKPVLSDNLPPSSPKANQKAIDALFDGVKRFTDQDANRSDCIACQSPPEMPQSS
jgi:hypothetical protein